MIWQDNGKMTKIVAEKKKGKTKKIGKMKSRVHYSLVEALEIIFKYLQW